MLDINLPKMDGYVTARELQNNPDLTSTPIVALTSHAMSGDNHDTAIVVRCDGCIEKSINPKTRFGQIKLFLPHQA